MSHLAVSHDSALWNEVTRHYAACVDATRAKDVDAFIAWFGDGGSFPRADGTRTLWADTRQFWEWRFSRILELQEFSIEVESVEIDAEGLVVVDFHEVSTMLVTGRFGRPAVRRSDLHNRNWWRREGEQLAAVNGAQPVTVRTLDGQPLEDADDPIGFAKWARVRDAWLRG